MTTELNATTNLRIVFMFFTSEFVGAVRTEAYDVLEKDLIVGHIAAGLVARELQPHAAEFARAPIGHQRVLGGVVAGEDREICWVEWSRKAGGARFEVAADVREYVARADTVLVAPARRTRGKLASATGLDPDVPIEGSRSDPFQLDAVLVQLIAEKHLVGERRVGEVPGVRVNLVLVTHCREETPGLDRET